jgi:transcriptional regulator with XRE-family HTH domain
MRRLMLSISQSTLAEGLGVTFQQVQKYEKGGNRVSASRLFQLSKILQVPISFFFEEISTDVSQLGFKDSAAPLAAVLATRDGLALATAFSKINDAKVRRAIVKIVEEIARKDSGGS